jgi:amino acid transporter
MGTPGGGLGLTFLVLGVTLFCSISITVAASRCTWAFARDNAIPGAGLFSIVNSTLGVPVWALVLTTLVQMLLGLINLGSSSAFTAFVSVGVIALAVSYAIPIAVSLLWNKRYEVSQARWNCGSVVGPIVNVVALIWITFEVVLFSMPTALPVTAVTMNYASVVFVGFLAISAIWYFVYARRGTFLKYPFRTELTDEIVQYTKAHPHLTAYNRSRLSTQVSRCWVGEGLRVLKAGCGLRDAIMLYYRSLRVYSRIGLVVWLYQLIKLL